MLVSVQSKYLHHICQSELYHEDLDEVDQQNCHSFFLYENYREINIIMLLCTHSHGKKVRQSGLKRTAVLMLF